MRRAKILSPSRHAIYDRTIQIPKAAAPRRGFSTSSLALIISGFCLTLLAQSAQAQPPPLKAAPTNPKFITWQQKALTLDAATIYDDHGHALGHIPSPIDRSHLLLQTTTTQLSTETLPVSYDLRTEGSVTSIKNQADCGSCWTFGTYGSLESWLLKNEAQTWDFSENHMKNYHGFDLAPCDGGNTNMSAAYLARWSGPVDESDDPYHDWDDRPSPGGPCQKYLKSALWFFTETDIKNALMTYGAMYVSMFYQSASYNSLEYTYYYDGTDDTNHGVTLVGWDDNKTVSGAPGNGAWLIKNSWGPAWGDQGYFWISYYDTMAVQEAVAFCNAVPTSTYLNNYQYDPLGWTDSVGYGSSSAWAANIFTPTANEKLEAVAIYAVDNNVSYEIYIYDQFNGSSFSSLLGSTSGTLINSGYHTISLPSVIDLTSGDDFSVVVKFTTTGFTYPIPTEDYYPGYSSAAAADPGQSYISSTGTTFTDITSSSGFENANVCIKALTTAPQMTPPLITSTPVTIAVVNELYTYDVDASGYPQPTYELVTYPSGMTINPDTGLIEWTPLAAGDFYIDVKAANGQLPNANQTFIITVYETPPYTDDVAYADIPVQGSVSGDYTDTQSTDDGYEAITEVREGNPARGFSSLEHKWMLDVTGGDTVTFYIEAHQTASSDNDNFVFAYSTDDSTYTDMLTVTKTTDDDTSQSFDLPPSLSGTVYIRVVDTDSTKRNQDMDTLYVDKMYIHSISSGPATYTLTVNIIGNGSVTTEPNQSVYTDGTVVTLSADADLGWSFDSWTDDLTGSTNPDTITMDSDKFVTANFTQNQYTITASADANGAIDPNGAIIKTYGQDQLFTAAPNIGYAIDTWYLDGNSVQVGADTYLLTGITADHTVHLTFTPMPSDNFNDNRRSSAWRLYVENHRSAWLVEDDNRLNMRAIGDVNNLLAQYVANGWSFDVNEDFKIEIDFHYTPLSDSNGWVGITMENDYNNYISISAGSDSNLPYFYCETLIDGNSVFEQTARDTNDGTLYISYDADTDQLYLSSTGYGSANSWHTVSGTLQAQWASDPLSVAIGGYSDAITFDAGDAYLDNFEPTGAIILGWPPVTDLNGDGYIDWDDVAIMTGLWLNTGQGIQSDINSDEIVNFLDFAEFAPSW